ncbi:AAA family ATPase [Deferribacter abyssi]|uniref:ATP-binding protein n=1 Tax=Deferribacter abyssi TaxID=213806 RepID=UPI003C18EAC4
MKKLPIGISTLRKIKENNCVYIDKTKIALKLIENGSYYFLSRPRRFGKTLFLDTLKEIFSGNKELFRGLYIYDKYDFKKYPVIHISFGSGGIKDATTLNSRIKEILEENCLLLSINMPTSETIGGLFKKVILQAMKRHGERVVILIDEYDKPILDNIEDSKRAKEIREELKNFYSVIKDSDPYIEFVFITGVSKFSKVSLFSGLNNLNDITIDKKYATICGYTQKDLVTEFAEHLKGQDFEKIKKWYNGYRWLGESVYNPFDILLFISKGCEFGNYWFSTATPTFLLKMIEKNRYHLPNLERAVKDYRMLDSFDVDNIDVEVLMWQTGYLTIAKEEKTVRGMFYYLDIPNYEVELSLFGSIADYITKSYNSAIISNNLYLSLLNKNLDMFMQELKSLYASIPYNNFTGEKLYEYEGYYVSVFYAYMKALGVDLIAENVTNKGRIDITLKFDDVIYIIEFKEDGKGALEQIKEKKYYEKYLSERKEIYLIGIEFYKQKRNINNISIEVIEH